MAQVTFPSHNGPVTTQPDALQPNLGRTVAAVARQLGVAPATLRTWDRRYGLGPSGHEAGAHRRYSPDDVARLEHMRKLVIAGVPPAEAAKDARALDLNPIALASVSELRVDVDGSVITSRAGGGRVVGIPGGTPAARGLARAAMALDGSGCRAIIDETLDRRGVVWTWDHLLLPVLVGVGQRWATTGKGIDVEHVLSDSITACLSERARSVPTPVNAAPVLLAAANEEMHALPLWATAAALAELSISTRMLGARVPAAAVVEAARRIGPGVVFVWAQVAGVGNGSDYLPLRTARPAPAVLLGGPGWSEPIPEGMQNPGDLTSTVRRIARIVGN